MCPPIYPSLGRLFIYLYYCFSEYISVPRRYVLVRALFILDGEPAKYEVLAIINLFPYSVYTISINIISVKCMYYIGGEYIVYVGPIIILYCT